MKDRLSIAARSLKDHYGIDGQIRALPGEYDLNFDVESDAGRFVFKLMRPDCTRDFIDLQIKAMACARNAGMGDIVPEIIPACSGDMIVSVAEEGETRIGWLISFLPGRLMADLTPFTPRLAVSIGETMGRLVRALESFEHPLLDRDLKWDLRQGGWIADELHTIDDGPHRALVKRVAARFQNELAPMLNALPRTPIHNDANDMNILVRETGPQRDHVSGIFDFGDMIRTPRICEPAIAMAYAMMGGGDALARCAALAAGFHKIIALSDFEQTLLLPLAKLRLAISVTNAAVQRVENPDNKYLSVSEAPAWRLLEKLERVDETTATEMIADACTASHHLTGAIKSPLARRKKLAPGNLALSYDAPLHLVRGERHFLFDANGDEYLDAYNNVPHVGHANPVVVDAVRRQMSLLNTNTRYLQDIHLDYAERMIELLPASLSKIVFLNSASEANELALRLARAAAAARDMLVMDHGYHGNTTGAMDISPYKFNHSKCAGAPPDWVHVTSQPNVFGGGYRGNDAPARYIDDVRNVLAGLKQEGRPVAGFISECLPSVGGQIVLPDGYLASVYELVRAAGGVCIADDVQTALGRLGDFFWGFDQQGVVPDIAVFGKPLGNGYPLAAVAMTEDISNAFSAGPEFFSTFGGSSAACAAGSAVLDALAAEDLQNNAKTTGDLMLRALHQMADRFDIIGDVRGYGLFIGVDLVTDCKSRAPATGQARHIKNRMREEKVLIGIEGPADNVLKIRPPMTFDAAAADQFLSVFERVLKEASAQP